METLLKDLRYGFRVLMRSPAFTAVAVLVLALGIGANTAIFSIVNAVILRPLPYTDPDRLLLVRETNWQKGLDGFSASPANFLDWKDQNQVFEDMAAYQTWSFNLTGVEEPQRISGARVSASFFSVLGIKPILGRTFLPEEDQPGGNPVVVISSGLWQRCFAYDPSLIDKTLTLNGKSYTVIGIMPREIKFPRNSELWVPMALDTSEILNRGLHLFWVIARLKPSVPLEQARTDMKTIALRLEQKYPETNAGWGVSIVPLHEQTVGPVRPTLLVLLGAVGFVLLIACANVANLLLVRATVRQKEIAIRTALGASRLRLVQQLLTESLLLALLGGALGLLLGLWGMDFLIALSPDNIPRVKETSIDGRVLGFTLAISLLTGMFFGLVPAFQVSKPNLHESLKEGARSSTGGFRRHRVRSLLVVSEMALTLVLLIGAGLMIKSFLLLREVHPGFNPRNILTLQISLPEPKYSEDHRKVAFYEQALERLQTLPGVQSVGAVTSLPLSGDNQFLAFTIEGRPPSASGERLSANYRAISPNYFGAMGIPLLKGRHFTDKDIGGAPEVVIINEIMARRFWPNEDPVGKRLVLTFPYGRPISREIVGMVGDVRHSGLDVNPRPEMYVPYRQIPSPYMALVVRTAYDPMSLVAAVRSEVRAVDKDQPLSNIRTMEQLLVDAVSQRRFNMLLLSIFAAVAMILAAVGIYGVMAYSVTQHTHEIGIRMALGAQPGDVLHMVVRQALKLIWTGLTIGLIMSFMLTRILSSLLYNVSATDPAIFVVLSLILTGVALLASYIPARRATKVDPMVALRYE